MLNSRFLAALLMMLPLGLFILPQVHGTAAHDKDPIGELIKQLGSSKYAERERALKELETIGLPALEQLRKAMTEGDLETRQRSKSLVKKIEEKMAADALLAPTKVKLSFKNTTVMAAIEELKRQSGYPIYIERDREPLTKRTVTLETGETTFWEAFDKLCAAANLAECPTGENLELSSLIGEYDNSMKTLPIIIGLRPDKQPVPLPPTKGIVKPERRTWEPGDIVVRDGKFEKFPTSYQGCVRIRLLPPDKSTGITIHEAKKNGVVYVLEVASEPRLQQTGIVGNARLDSALDDHGQQLKETTEPNKPSRLYGTAQPRQVVVSLELAEKPAKSLSEVKGVLTVQTLTPLAEAMITVEDVMKSVGKTVQGKWGGTIEVFKIEKKNNDAYLIGFQFNTPPGFYPPPTTASFKRLELKGHTPMYQVYFNKLLPVLVDQKGSTLTAGGTISFSGFGSVQGGRVYTSNVETEFRAEKGVGEPAFFVLWGHRVVTVQVPFRFDGVQLKQP